jgi:hypothetical protein
MIGVTLSESSKGENLAQDERREGKSAQSQVQNAGPRCSLCALHIAAKLRGVKRFLPLAF